MHIVFIGLGVAIFAGLMWWDANNASKALERRILDQQEAKRHGHDLHHG